MIISKGISFGSGIQVGETAIAYPTYSVSTNKFAFLQGDVLTITVSTTNVLDGSILYWNIEGSILPGYINVQSGSLTVKNNQAVANITFLNDLRSLVNPGMSNFFYISIRSAPATGSILTSTQKCIISAAGIAASGGTVTTANGYRYHAFLSSGTFTTTFVPDGSTVEVITVGGGGGGGFNRAGGGGAGGVVISSAFSVSTDSYTVVVGGGGGPGVTGSSPGFLGTSSSFVSVVALGGGPGGGGGGATSTAISTAGASGGGGSSSLDVGGCPGGNATQPSSASGGYGNPGGWGVDGIPNTRPCGGGGGAGGVGGDAGYYYGGNGGPGLTHPILNGASRGYLNTGSRYVAGGGYGSSTGVGTYAGVAGIGQISYGGGGNSGESGNGGIVIVRYRL